MARSVHFNSLFHGLQGQPGGGISSLQISLIFSFVLSALVWSVLGAGMCPWRSSSGHPELSVGSFAGTAFDENPAFERKKIRDNL